MAIRLFPRFWSHSRESRPQYPWHGSREILVRELLASFRLSLAEDTETRRGPPSLRSPYSIRSPVYRPFDLLFPRYEIALEQVPQYLLRLPYGRSPPPPSSQSHLTLKHRLSFCCVRNHTSLLTVSLDFAVSRFRRGMGILPLPIAPLHAPIDPPLVPPHLQTKLSSNADFLFFNLETL